MKRGHTNLQWHVAEHELGPRYIAAVLARAIPLAERWTAKGKEGNPACEHALLAQAQVVIFAVAAVVLLQLPLLLVAVVATAVAAALPLLPLLEL